MPDGGGYSTTQGTSGVAPSPTVTTTGGYSTASGASGSATFSYAPPGAAGRAAAGYSTTQGTSAVAPAPVTQQAQTTTQSVVSGWQNTQGAAQAAAMQAIQNQNQQREYSRELPSVEHMKTIAKATNNIAQPTYDKIPNSSLEFKAGSSEAYYGTGVRGYLEKTAASIPVPSESGGGRVLPVLGKSVIYAGVEVLNTADLLKSLAFNPLATITGAVAGTASVLGDKTYQPLSPLQLSNPEQGARVLGSAAFNLALMGEGGSVLGKAVARAVPVEFKGLGTAKVVSELEGGKVVLLDVGTVSTGKPLFGKTIIAEASGQVLARMKSGGEIPYAFKGSASAVQAGTPLIETGGAIKGFGLVTPARTLATTLDITQGEARAFKSMLQGESVVTVKGGIPIVEAKPPALFYQPNVIRALETRVTPRTFKLAGTVGDVDVLGSGTVKNIPLSKLSRAAPDTAMSASLSRGLMKAGTGSRAAFTTETVLFGKATPKFIVNVFDKPIQYLGEPLSQANRFKVVQPFTNILKPAENVIRAGESTVQKVIAVSEPVQNVDVLSMVKTKTVDLMGASAASAGQELYELSLGARTAKLGVNLGTASVLSFAPQATRSASSVMQSQVTSVKQSSGILSSIAFKTSDLLKNVSAIQSKSGVDLDKLNAYDYMRGTLQRQSSQTRTSEQTRTEEAVKELTDYGRAFKMVTAPLSVPLIDTLKVPFALRKAEEKRKKLTQGFDVFIKTTPFKKQYFEKLTTRPVSKGEAELIGEKKILSSLKQSIYLAPSEKLVEAPEYPQRNMNAIFRPSKRAPNVLVLKRPLQNPTQVGLIQQARRLLRGR